MEAHDAWSIVLRPEAFFRKGWAQYQLDGLVRVAVSGAQVLRERRCAVRSGDAVDRF
jgi:hypothetical protein